MIVFLVLLFSFSFFASGKGKREQVTDGQLLCVDFVFVCVVIVVNVNCVREGKNVFFCRLVFDGHKIGNRSKQMPLLF